MIENCCKHNQPEGAPCDECAAKQEGVSSLAAPLGSASGDKCNCLKQLDDSLREKGFKLSDACSCLVLTENTLRGQYGMPLQRTHGERMKRADPKMIYITHCPFCGQKL